MTANPARDTIAAAMTGHDPHVGWGAGAWFVECLAADCTFAAHGTGNVDAAHAAFRGHLADVILTTPAATAAVAAEYERRLDLTHDLKLRLEREQRTLHGRIAAVEELAARWEADRDSCLAWIDDPTMHVDADHPRRLSETAATLDKHAQELRAALTGTRT